MNSESINNRALECLARQNWTEAQRLFFYNAKKFPSHKTYNNLGYYLISEGLECKNGKVRSAHKLGVKYLIKASMLATSVTNIIAQVNALSLSMRTLDGDKHIEFVARMRDLYKRALEIEYSPQLQYNFLRCSYILGERGDALIAQVEHLISELVTPESTALYLAMLCNMGEVDKGKTALLKYCDIIDDYDRAIFSVKLGQLSAEDLDQLYVDISDKINEAFIPPDIVICAYFGCKVHGTEW